jgi:hypothetical protein
MSKFYDFIGNEFSIGSYVARSGGGNNEGLYSMLLYKVEEISLKKEKLKVTRLNYHYTGVISKLTTWVDPSKYVVVNPPQEAINMFEYILTTPGVLGSDDKDLSLKVCHWLSSGKKFW